jgi:two-component system LytT family response regulator
MQKIKALIVDDELRARTLLSNLISDYCKDIEIVELCSDIPNTIKAIHKHKANLVFLDIEMPGYSGLELLDFFNIDEVDFSIIYTTAYNHYAIEAIKRSAFDYILKPVEPDELERSVDRFRKKLSFGYSNKELANNRIAVPTGNGLKLINLENIIYFKADNTYTEIYINDGTKLLVSRILKNFEETLQNNKDFFRCNKSHIINLKYVTDYVKSDGGYLTMDQKHNITLSPEKVDSFLDSISIVKRR